MVLIVIWEIEKRDFILMHLADLDRFQSIVPSLMKLLASCSEGVRRSEVLAWVMFDICDLTLHNFI
jgi:hypothetical protein